MTDFSSISEIRSNTVSPTHSEEPETLPGSDLPSVAQVSGAQKATKFTPIGPVTPEGLPQWSPENIVKMQAAIEEMVIDAQLDPKMQELFDLVSLSAAPGYSSPLSAVTSNSGFVAMDISYFIRTIPMYVEKYGLASSHVLQSMGLTSFLSTFFGALSIASSYKGYQEAAAVGDIKGQIWNALWNIANIGQFGGGVGLGGSRVFSVWAIGHHIPISPHSPSILARIAHHTSTVGLYFLQFFYLFIACAFYFRARFKAQFQTKIKKCTTSAEKAEFFKKRLTGDAIQFTKQMRYEKTLEAATNCFNRMALRLTYRFSSFQDSQWETLTEKELQVGFIKFAKEHIVKKLSKEVKDSKKDIMTAVEGHYTDAQLTALGETLVKIRSLHKKERKLADMLGGKRFGKVKALYGRLQIAENSGLSTEIEKIKGEFVGITDKVKKGINRDKWLERGVVIASIIGMLFLAFALANPVTGLAAILITIGTLIASATFMVADGMFLHGSTKSRATGKWDYAMFAINVIMIAASIALSLLFYASPLALIITGAIAAAWLGLSIFALAKTWRNKRFNRLVAKEVANAQSLTAKEIAGLEHREERAEFNAAVEAKIVSDKIAKITEERAKATAERVNDLIVDLQLTSRKAKNPQLLANEENQPRVWSADLASHFSATA